MKKNRRSKTQMKTLTYILIIMLSSMFMIFPMNNSNSETNFNEVDNILPEPIKIIGNPQPSKISSAPWWNGAWRYRRLINVTNPNSNFAFTNYTTSVVFNYTIHTVGTPDYPMNGDLSDIRIVQEGVLRKYYYKIDYPNTDFVTVWFDVDIDKSPNHIDTDNIFLYFNGSTKESVDPDYFMDENHESNSTKDAMGWIRNGHFELDGETGQKLTTEVFGWTYTNAAPIDYDIDGENEDNLNYMHELTESNDNQERTFGNWSFKWGDLGSWLESDDLPDPPAVGHDFEGTLYTYPFIVPTVEGTGVDLKLEVYRNFRVYNTKDSHPLGFYIRLCEDYSSDVDVHREVLLKEQYMAKDDSGETFVYDVSYPSNLYDTRNDAGVPPYSNDGEITGKISINLDATYMGRLLFLEIGTYGKDDSGFQTAFTQVDDVSFNYEMNTALNDDVQEVAGSATFITKDVDGRIVPNAEVTIMEEYGDPTTIGPYETSEEDGSVSFSNVAYGSYNVSVNYTIPYSGLEEVVYDSQIISKEFLIDGSGSVYELILNMSTIDFEIVDYGGYPLTYGYINVSYSKGGAALDILQLQNDGKATFRWLNRSFYYYQVYYNNTDYSPNPTPLNASYIWRDNYSKYPDGDKHQFHTLDINENNQEPPSSQYHVKERIYMNDSMIQISDLKLLNVSISIQNNEFLTNVSVYYIDSSDTTDTLSHRIFFDDSYVGETSDTISIDLMTVVNSQLSSENRLAYGLLIDVWGINSSICTGDIEINTTEAWHVFNKTAISKLNIRVLGDGATLSDAIVTIKSNSPIFGNIVSTTLTSDKDRDSFAFSDNELPFMFLRGHYYNFSVIWEGASIQDTFNVSGPDPDQWAPNTHVGWYNYSLLKYNFTLEFDIDMGSIDPSEYKLKFDNLTSPEEVIWGNNVSVQVYFNKTEDNWVSNSAVTAPDSIQLKIQLAQEVIFTFNMNPTGSPGYYMIEFNSSILSAGLAGVFYKLVITGAKSPFTLQGDEITTLYVMGKGTVLSLHDYNNVSVEMSEISQTFGESINLTVKYYNVSNSPLTDATLTYEWLGLDPIQFYEDPINVGYFTATLNTSLAGVWGLRSILFTATLENYTTQSLLTSISITERPTLLNSTADVIFFSKSVFALETETFEFNYTDILTLTRISNPEDASYSWQKLDEFGDPILGESKIGALIETADHRYILDLDTASMEVGDYFVFISLHKINYELRNVVISLTIEERLTSVNGSLGPFIINLGDTLNFTYSYTDDLINTSITNLDTQSYVYNGTASGSGSLGYDSNNEIYYLDGFTTASLISGNYTFILTFDKENYTSQVVVVSLVITYTITDYQTFLALETQSPSNFTTDIYWRDNITIGFNFTTQYQSEIPVLANPTTIYLQFLDESLNAIGSSINLINYNISMGVYSYKFNTSHFSLIGGESYYISIYASKTSYTPPSPLQIFFKVQSVLTNLTIHNYTTGIEFPLYTLTEYWNQTLGLTVYFRELISDAPLTNAYVTFSWAYGSGQINSDGAKGPGYYSFFFDTGNATEVGTYTITILALKQNFTNGVPSPSLIITIINRPTFLRPTGILTNNSVIFISEKIFALETEYFEFNYTDVFTSNFIQNADEASYNWQKLDEFGDPIPGENGIGTLNEIGDRYILDFGTALMDVGEYFILITLDKLNYESWSTVFSLIIENRLTIINGSTGPFIINLGDTLNFTYSYTDDLINTSITNLDTQSYVYNGTASGSGSLGYDSNNKIYYLIGFDTASLPNGTYTITITVDKQSYASQVVLVSLIINFVFTDYKTFLTQISQNPSDFLTGIYWRDNVTFTFNFTTSFQLGPKILSHATTVILQFLDESLNAYGPSINLINYNTSKGIYSYTFNTSQLSFIGGESYYIAIYASKTTPTLWTPPEPLQILFKIRSVLTDLTIHNYTTGTIFPSYTLTEYWNQTFGITFYFGELISSSPITGATVTYSWAFGSGQVNPDGVKGPGYYSFFFDTGNVTEIGSYIISISAVKQNFSIGVPNPNLIITIINRPTLLNTNEDALYLRREFYVLDSFNFTFDFTDVLTNFSIWNADEKSFILNKRDNNGDIIPGSTILGFLHETADHQYILDLDTETLQVGEYSVIVTLSKDNYDFRVAIISLTIHVRVFSINFSTDTRINLVSGGTVQFQITLTDPNNNSVPVIGAYLTFTIKGIEYGTVTGGIFDNNDGSYTVNTLPIAEPFIGPETFIGTLIIEKANFSSETRDFTVVVQMTEIFSGMPMFYFILIISAIIGIAGSLITYRVVQQARIPKFVKKIRKVKGTIKSKKAITESHLTKTKDQMMVKLYGDDWRELELSLEDTLGIVDLKLKPTPLKAKKSKKGGDRD